MFPTRYFANSYFAPRYFPKIGANPIIGVGDSDEIVYYHINHWHRRAG